LYNCSDEADTSAPVLNLKPVYVDKTYKTYTVNMNGVTKNILVPRFVTQNVCAITTSTATSITVGSPETIVNLPRRSDCLDRASQSSHNPTTQQPLRPPDLIDLTDRDVLPSTHSTAAAVGKLFSSILSRNTTNTSPTPADTTNDHTPASSIQEVSVCNSVVATERPTEVDVSTSRDGVGDSLSQTGWCQKLIITFFLSRVNYL
jgi:hypothetical protein